MCGISGIIHLNGVPVSESVLSEMNDMIAHRGPDDKGIYIDKNIGLAHRRLSIIDPEGGKQPFMDEDENIVLVYNGEVYNFKEIRNELGSGFTFRTESDTEVVLNAYKKWGIDCIHRFRGMFAFSLYDRKQRLLYVVRDRVGIKPVYFYHAKDCFLFASELIPLVKTNYIKHEINPTGLSGYLRYQYVPTPHTIYKDVHKLEPGCYLKIHVANGSIEKCRYWDLDINITVRDEQTYFEELNALLDDTIKIYIRSDVPFGSFLSGGLDSTTVTALMSQYLDDPVKTFSIGYEEENYSELSYASEASNILNTEHYSQVVRDKITEGFLAKLIQHFGEPFGDSSAIPTYFVSQSASRHVKMVLSGDGGDELFAGYNSYLTTFQDLSCPLYKLKVHVWKNIARLMPFGGYKNAFTYKGMTFLEKHNKQREIFNGLSLRELLNNDIEIFPSRYQYKEPASLDPVTSFQAQDFRTYLVDDILTKVDRMSMANSLEVRVPFLDHKVVEFAFTLPLYMKVNTIRESKQIATKYLLRKSAGRFVPENFFNRPKWGFGIPVLEWSHNNLRPLIEDELRDRRNEIYTLISYDHVQALLDAFYKGNRNHVTKIWVLFIFALWMKNVHMRLTLKRVHG